MLVWTFFASIWAQTISPKCTSTQDNLTTDNYNEATIAISTAVREAVNSKQKQTPDNLAIVADVFVKFAAFINNQTFIERTVNLLFLCATFVYTWGAVKLTGGSSPSLRLCRTWWPQWMACNYGMLMCCKKLLQSACKVAQNKHLSCATFNLIEKN